MAFTSRTCFADPLFSDVSLLPPPVPWPSNAICLSCSFAPVYALQACPHSAGYALLGAMKKANTFFP